MTPRKPAASSVYRLRITLQEIVPPIWRCVEVSANTRLCCLHDVIQIVMGWTDSHLHQFEKEGKYYGVPDTEFDDINVIEEGIVPLRSLLKAEGDSALYLYDFGDNWRHDVVLEQVRRSPGAALRPVCMGGERHCPPEDVGGVPGYAEFLEVIFEPRHEEHEHFTAWCGGRFQPEEFDVAAVNDALSQLRWPVRHRRTLRRI